MVNRYCYLFSEQPDQVCYSTCCLDFFRLQTRCFFFPQVNWFLFSTIAIDHALSVLQKKVNRISLTHHILNLNYPAFPLQCLITSLSWRFLQHKREFAEKKFAFFFLPSKFSFLFWFGDRQESKNVEWTPGNISRAKWYDFGFCAPDCFVFLIFFYLGISLDETTRICVCVWVISWRWCRCKIVKMRGYPVMKMVILSLLLSLLVHYSASHPLCADLSMCLFASCVSLYMLHSMFYCSQRHRDWYDLKWEEILYV